MDPIKIVDKKTYRVELAVPVKRGPMLLRPRDANTMTGAVLREIVEVDGWEAIADAHPVA